MQDEVKAESIDELHSTVKLSLHARKWATITKKNTLSNTSGAISFIDAESTFEDSWKFFPLPEESNQVPVGDIVPSDSEYELSSRSKRKLSRAPGALEESTKVVTDIITGLTGLELHSDMDDVSDQAERVQNRASPPKSECRLHDFRRRDSHGRVYGPSGERVGLQKGVPLNSDGSHCILDINPGDEELIDYIGRIVDSGNISNEDSSRCNENGEVLSPEYGKSVAQYRKEAFLVPHIEHEPSSSPVTDAHHGSFNKSLLSPTMNSSCRHETYNDDERLSIDSSESSPSMSCSPPVLRHLSFNSTDLPLNGSRVAPIPRVLDLRQESGCKRGEEGTTTDSDDFYSSQPSSQGDALNSILPPIYSQTVKTTLAREEPDFEELERYFPTHQMSLFIGTWNMHSEDFKSYKKEVPLLVEEFLLPPECEFLQDMYVIGTQECTPHKREWEVTVQATLGPTHVLIRSESLGDIHLIILVRREMIWVIRDVQSSTVACGAGGVMRNKGAVGIVLTIFGSSILFITSHLRAHTSKVKERNLDAARISTSLDFSRYGTGGKRGHTTTDPGLGSEPPPPPPPLDCTDKVDCVFWFGDLNYRLTCERETADSAISSNQLDFLIRHDQLIDQIRQRQVFPGFAEAPIHFPPTFKFDPGTTEYDTSTKRRVPSYTDRILYKSKQDSVTPQRYHFCPNLTFSDHRPVFGVYLVTLKPSTMSATIRATGWFDKRAYARGMKRRQLYPRPRTPSQDDRSSSDEKKRASFVLKAVNKPVQKVRTASHKSSAVCSVM